MYPNTFFSLFPPFARTSVAFVAMSFDPRFKTRWTDVIDPALRGLSRGNEQLQPYRVDLSKSGDAILTDILDRIGSAHLIFADITALDVLNDRPVRNANVLYEVGLAHARRLPEEVLVFRSDTFRLDFDIAGVRVHDYDPDGDRAGAIETIHAVALEAGKERDQRRNLAVRAAAQRMTAAAIYVLMEMGPPGTIIQHPSPKTMGDAVSMPFRIGAIELLLDLGAIATNTAQLTRETFTLAANKLLEDSNLIHYTITPFGHAILEHLISTIVSAGVESYLSGAAQAGESQSGGAPPSG